MKTTTEYFSLPSARTRQGRTPFLFYVIFSVFWAGSVVSLVGDVFASILG